jgi:hypothetical protein
MADYIADFFSAKIYGIPIWFLVIITLFIFVVIYVKKNVKPKPFKKKVLKEEVDKDFKEEFKNTGFKVNKRLLLGFTTIGFALKQINAVDLPKLVKIKGKLIYSKNEGKNIIAFSKCKPNPISRFLALLGIRIKYVLVDEEYLRYDNNTVIINPSANHSTFCGVLIFSTKAKEITENIAYKINRENELEELINFIPKMSYLETNVSSKVAELREKADIEKEKYKGQVED